MTFVYLQKETNLIKLDQLDLPLNHKIFVKTVFKKKASDGVTILYNVS